MPLRSTAPRYSANVSKFQAMPASSIFSDMSSTACSVRTIAPRWGSRVGAIENPQLPATTDVTPCQHDDVSAGSQNTWAS